jgi:hypothetical protein
LRKYLGKRHLRGRHCLLFGDFDHLGGMDSVMDKDPSALPDSIFLVASPLVRGAINTKYGAPGEIRTPNLLIRSARFTC